MDSELKLHLLKKDRVEALRSARQSLAGVWLRLARRRGLEPVAASVEDALDDVEAAFLSAQEDKSEKTPEQEFRAAIEAASTADEGAEVDG